MNISRAAVFVLVIACGLVACSKTEPSPAGSVIPTITLQQEWFPYSGFAGEAAASRRFAMHNAINLKLLPGSEQIDPIKLVLSGSAEFGVVGGDLLVAAVAKGAPLVAIGVVNERTPTVFLAALDSGINSPRDFPGHTVGILPGTNTERVYELMMKRAQVDRSKIRELPVPFDLQTFLLKQYDVRPAFVYDEPVSLEDKGFHYQTIAPANFGVVFTGTVYFTTRQTLADHPADVERLLKSLVQGWEFAIANPAMAIDDVHALFPTTDTKRELRALKLGTDYFRGPQGMPLACDTSVWTDMIKGLEEIQAIPLNAVTASQVWEPKPLATAYEELARDKKQ